MSYGFIGEGSRMFPCLDSFLGERCTDRISYVPADFHLSCPTREVAYCAGFRSDSTEQSRACFLASIHSSEKGAQIAYRMFPLTSTFPVPPAKLPTVRDFVRIPRSRVAHVSLPRFIPRRKVHRSHIVCSR